MIRFRAERWTSFGRSDSGVALNDQGYKKNCSAARRCTREKFRRRRRLEMLLCSMILCMMTAETAMARSIERLVSALPPDIGGWKQDGPPRAFTKSNLYDYIDGGAELYISFDFQKLLAVRYRGPAEEEIVIDIFDMGHSYNAFGVFSLGRESDDRLVGQGSEYNSGLLTFWKDRYYVSITAYPETEEKKRLVLELGKRLAAAIPDKGTLPPVVGLLPETDLVPGTIRYFRHPIWLNSHLFISNENIFGLDGRAHAVLAKYGHGGTSLFLLLVLYPDEANAREAEGTFRTAYLHGTEGGAVEKSPGKWAGCLREGNALAAVFQAPSRAALIAALEAIGRALKSRA